MDTDHHAICRPAKLEALIDLRNFVETAVKQSGLDADNIFAFKLASEEICTNIIDYGYPDRDQGYIVIAFELEKGLARLRIWDDGISFSPHQLGTPDLDATCEEREIGGLGMHLVKELMDKMEYYQDGNNSNVLVLEKHISPIL